MESSRHRLRMELTEKPNLNLASHARVWCAHRSDLRLGSSWARTNLSPRASGLETRQVYNTKRRFGGKKQLQLFAHPHWES